MAWNEPGKSDQDPWGSKQNSPQSNDDNDNIQKPSQPNNEVDEMIRKAQQMFGKKGGGGGGNGFGVGSFNSIGPKGFLGIAAVVVVVWLLSGIYIIDSAQRGVVTQFGAYNSENTAGPHWHIPYPFQSVIKVNVDRIRIAEIGYRTDARNNSGSVASESLMLTKDENIVDIKIAVQYKVQSASDYLFQVSDPDVSLRAVTESALREIVGQNEMDFVLTEGRNEVVASVKKLAQQHLDKYKTGLVITSVNLQDAQPPEQVQSSFADVVKAREDRERLISEAEAYSNDIIPKARGGAARQTEEASAYHDRVIAEAKGKANRFTSVLTEYTKAPEVMRERLYIESITSMLQNSSKVMMGSESSNNILYIPLDKMQSGNSGQSSNNDIGSVIAPALNAVNNNRNSNQPPIRDYLRTREIR